MKLPLSRTRAKLVHLAKGFVFDQGGFQKMLDLRRRHQLQDLIGFRGQWDEHRRFQIEYLKKQGLMPSHDFLEIGCGPLTGGMPIIEYLAPNKYIGLDIRSSVLNLSWGEVGIAGLSEKNPRLICSSDFGASELGNHQVAFAMAFSVLFHLSDELLSKLLNEIRGRLKSSGRFIANVNTDIDDSTWLQFPFLKRSISDYEAVAELAGLSVIQLGTLEQNDFRLLNSERKNVILSFSRRA